MEIVSIYVTGLYQKQEKIAYYGYSLWQENKKTPKEDTGHFPCESPLEAELTSLILSVSSLDTMKKETELLVYTNFQCIREFIDCHVYQWEMAGWEMENGQKPPQVELWKKLSDLFFCFDVDLIDVEATDEKIQGIMMNIESAKMM